MKLSRDLREELCLRLVNWGRYELMYRSAFRRWMSEFPVVCLCDDMKAWGRCICSEHGCRIELRTALLEEHAWYAACDVFLHEIAHWLTYCQIGTAETAHGDTFRRICSQLGANPAASSHYEPLDTLLFLDDDALESRMTPIELKIRKLLALSESPNEHEAHLALTKARELMSKYDMEHVKNAAAADAGASDPLITVDISLGTKSISPVEWGLIGLLSTYYDVTCIGNQEQLVVNGVVSERKAVTVAGRRSKVKIALYVREYIKNYMAMSWKATVVSCRKNVRMRRDFELGVLEGIREQLERQQRDDAKVEVGNERSLVKAELNDYVSRRFPRLRMRHGRSIRVDRECQSAGHAAGRSMEFRPGLGDDGAASSPKQLT